MKKETRTRGEVLKICEKRKKKKISWKKDTFTFGKIQYGYM
jgi:hypothetical protein